MLWDIGSAKRIHTFVGHTDVVHSLAFSSNGSVLVSGGADDTVRMWDTVTGKADPVVTEAPHHASRSHDNATHTPSTYSFFIVLFILL